METRVISIADRYPEFIVYQHESIKKFLDKSVKYTIFNNAANLTIRDKINSVCEKLGIEVHNIYCNYNQHTSPIHAEAMNSIWKNFLSDKKCGVLWFDGDMFLISDIDIEFLTENYDMGYSPIYRGKEWEIECMWTGILFFNMYTLDRNIDFSLTEINGYRTDTAGFTYWYLKAHPEYRRTYFRVLNLEDFEENNLFTELNGCTSNMLDFIDGKPLGKIERKIFPYEKEDENYISNYKKEYDEHKKIALEYNFPRPYSFDLIKLWQQEKSFLFHYKSGSWNGLYGDGKNKYATEKKEAIRNLLEIDNSLLKEVGVEYMGKEKN